MGVPNCCGCCGEEIAEKGGLRLKENIYCDAVCKRAHEVYRRLFVWARLKAKRYKTAEVDPTKAQNYLRKFLEELRRSRAEAEICALTSV